LVTLDVNLKTIRPGYVVLSWLKYQSIFENKNYLTGKSKMKLVSRFLKNESGATAIEYGLIAALISVAIIGGATALGTGLNTLFTNIDGQL
jgi:pilus assembly protein Flp/PilA